MSVGVDSAQLNLAAEVVTRPPNKGMKQTKPAQAMELRSLSPVFAVLRGRRE